VTPRLTRPEGKLPTSRTPIFVAGHRILPILKHPSSTGLRKPIRHGLRCPAAEILLPMKNWTVRQRITWSFGAVIALMIGMGVFAFMRLATIETETADVQKDSVP